MSDDDPKPEEDKSGKEDKPSKQSDEEKDLDNRVKVLEEEYLTLQEENQDLYDQVEKINIEMNSLRKLAGSAGVAVKVKDTKGIDAAANKMRRP